MSAVLDTLKMDAVRREDNGFTTMREYVTGLAGRSADTTTVSADVTLLNPVLPPGNRVVVAYSNVSLPRYFDLHDIGAGAEAVVRMVRSNSFVVRVEHGAATMQHSMEWDADDDEDEYRERGVSFLRIPREKIHSFQVSVRIADLPRKLPRVRLISRSHEGDDA